MNAQPGTSSPRAARPVEAQLSDQDFRRIAAILYQDSGIHLSDGKVSLVYSRLAKRLRSLGMESFRDYCTLVASPEGKDERRRMLSALTTNVTRFFREPHHFTELAQQFRERWSDHARRGGRIRIWSAGCSTGDEPYSIALTVLRELPDANRYDVRILATDIDEIVLRHGRDGVYSAQAIEPALEHGAARWLEREDDGAFSVGPEVRDLVSFRQLNLMASPWPMSGTFQAIFCRNVAIYFDEPTQERLWGRFAQQLTPDGRLFIGHSERVADPVFESAGMTSYRLSEKAR